MPPESGLPPDEPCKDVGKKASDKQQDATDPLLGRAFEKVPESDPSHKKRSGDDVKKTMSGQGQDVTVVLQRAYASHINEPIPQAMLDMLDKLN